MEITCHKQDVERFRELGFETDLGDPPGPEVNMTDDSANYAHAGELPLDVPWHGYHSSGDDYGPCEIACDGREFIEAECGRDGGYVIQWNKEANNPQPGSVETIRRMHRVREQAKLDIQNRSPQ